MRLIERVLGFFDNEERWLIVRWRLFKSDWLPYRTAMFKGVDEAGEMKLSPWEWHRPRRFQ